MVHRSGYGGRKVWVNPYRQTHIRPREMGRLVGSGNVRTGAGRYIDASTSFPHDFAFNLARFYFTRSESRYINLSVKAGTQKYEIWKDTSDSSSSVIVEGGDHFIIPSGDWLRVEVSGVNGSGYCHYGVYVEEL